LESLVRRSAGLGVALVALGGLAVAPPARADVVDLTVSFHVKDTNRTAVPCSSDGLPYTIRGHLTIPSSELPTASASTVALYLHDFGVGEWFWRFKSVVGYDFARAMASSGHPTLSLAGLGYRPSDRPDGMAPCIGSEADIVHQIIGGLHSGDYQSSGQRRRFSRVVLAGQSVGALIAQVEAYSFSDAAGLGVFGWADQGASDSAIAHSFQAGGMCALGGQPADETSGPPGYVYFDQTDSDFRSGFFNQANTDPAVVDAATALRPRGPCGDIDSVVPAITTDSSHLSNIAVPVLLVYGESDASYPPSGAQQQAQQYSASTDVSTVVLAHAGHAFTLERTAPAFRGALDHWLDTRWPVPTVSGPHPHPGPTGPVATLRLAPSSLSMGRTGRVRLAVQCAAPASRSCHGRVTLRAIASSTRRPPGSAHPPRRVGRVIAYARFLIRTGPTQRVLLYIDRRAQRALVAAKRLDATVTAVGATSRGIPLYATNRVTLRIRGQ